MLISKGMSFIEVLISLLLMTTTVLTLSQLKWQAARTYKHTENIAQHLLDTDNAHEQLVFNIHQL